MYRQLCIISFFHTLLRVRKGNPSAARAKGFSAETRRKGTRSAAQRLHKAHVSVRTRNHGDSRGGKHTPPSPETPVAAAGEKKKERHFLEGSGFTSTQRETARAHSKRRRTRVIRRVFSGSESLPHAGAGCSCSVQLLS